MKESGVRRLVLASSTGLRSPTFTQKYLLVPLLTNLSA